MNSKQLSIFDTPARPEKVTQGMKILKYMQDYGSITPVEAFRDLGVMRLGARSTTWSRKASGSSTNGRTAPTAWARR